MVTDTVKATFTPLLGSKGMSPRDIVAALTPLIGEPDYAEFGPGDGYSFQFSKKENGSNRKTDVGSWSPVPWGKDAWALRHIHDHTFGSSDQAVTVSISKLSKLYAQANRLALSAGFAPGDTLATSYSLTGKQYAEGVRDFKALLFGE